MSDQNLVRLKLLVSLLRPARLTRIVDVGASPINPAPYEMLLEAGLAEVIGFEPQPEAYAALQENPQRNRKVLPYALGDGSEGTLNICAQSGFTSLLEPNPEFLEYANRWRRVMRVVERIPLKTSKLDDIDEIDAFDMLKIDIQGGEVSVFENGLKKLADASVVYSELAYIPIYRNQPLLDAQMQALRPAGFELHKMTSMTKIMIISEASKALKPKFHKNQLIDGDAVFIRDLLRLDGYSNENLKHLAVLADSVFQSYDLVLKLLEGWTKDGSITEDAVSEYVALLPGQN